MAGKSEFLFALKSQKKPHSGASVPKRTTELNACLHSEMDLCGHCPAPSTVSVRRKCIFGFAKFSE